VKFFEGGDGVLTLTHFSFSNLALYEQCRVTDYGDKLLRAIGTTDPGAVPGGSTTSPGIAGEMLGPN
jgi:hypothetical protein